MTTRKILPTPVVQGANESISYEVDTLPWGGSPSNPVIHLWEGSTDVTATKMPGASSISGDSIILPPISGLEAGKYYRLTVRFDSGGNTFETYNILIGEQ